MADGKDSGLASGTSGSPQLSLDNDEMIWYNVCKISL